MSLLNSFVVKTLPLVPKSIVRQVAKRYIAGDTLLDAVATVKRLEKLGASSTVDVLGEFVTSRERAEHERNSSLSVLDEVANKSLPVYLSIKLTSLGLDIDSDFCYDNLMMIMRKANESKIFVRLDMENSPYTTKTIDLYKRIRTEGFNNIGVVIQAYMRRSEDDIRDLKNLNADVRLCKGIYVEEESIAYKERDEIRGNYKKLFRQLISSGMKVRIATHDDDLIDDARNFIAKENISKDAYEFQMLLGVREEKRDAIIKEGHPMRIYVPFGEDWYGYSTRRLKENPQVAGYVFKAMLTGGK